MMKTDSLVKETFRIAWPAVVESVFIVLVGMLDTYMVSPIGKKAIAAISLANQPKILVSIIFFAANTAISALIARRKGAEEKGEAHDEDLTKYASKVIKLKDGLIMEEV